MERTFGCQPDTPAQSRHFVDDTMARWGVDRTDPAATLTDDLKLVTSELVTNATRFCTAQVRVTVTAHRHRIELAVADDNPTPAELGELSADSVGGRGLAIVEVMSDRWGQRPWDGREKVVWCELAVPAGSVLGDGCQV